MKCTTTLLIDLSSTPWQICPNLQCFLDPSLIQTKLLWNLGLNCLGNTEIGDLGVMTSVRVQFVLIFAQPMYLVQLSMSSKVA